MQLDAAFTVASFAAIAVTLQTANAFSNDIQLRCRGQSKISRLRHDVPSSPVCRRTSSHTMVRNVDLPEAIVFYGLESVLEPPVGTSRDAPYDLKLRPGILRILHECKDVGTAALILSEVNGLEDSELNDVFNEAWMNSYTDSREMLQKLRDDDNPTLSLKCIDAEFTTPCHHDNEDESDNDPYIYYNLLSLGKSPSPAFLLDSLQSIRIDPRGFGGSSGFARGQWVEPRRSPLTARTVVFVAGDWESCNNNIPWLERRDKQENMSSVRDRCAAARAAGCRIVYL